jgi:hypothetical protein
VPLDDLKESLELAIPDHCGISIGIHCPDVRSPIARSALLRTKKDES